MVALQHDAIVGDARRPLLLLLAAVSCVLLIACVNLANLMTARGVTRQPELALRVALGASRSRVVRLLLAESVALAIVSAVVGVLVAWWSLDLLVGIAPARCPRLAGGVDRHGRVDLYRAGCLFLFTGGRPGAALAFNPRRSSPGHRRDAHVGRIAYQRRWLTD